LGLAQCSFLTAHAASCPAHAATLITYDYFCAFFLTLFFAASFFELMIFTPASLCLFLLLPLVPATQAISILELIIFAPASLCPFHLPLSFLVPIETRLVLSQRLHSNIPSALFLL